MKAKTIVTSADLRRGNPEERLAPNEKLVVATKSGKPLKIRPVDQGKRNRLAELNQIIKEIPIARDASSRRLLSIFLENRE